jgi:hypothetical protein
MNWDRIEGNWSTPEPRHCFFLGMKVPFVLNDKAQS